MKMNLYTITYQIWKQTVCVCATGILLITLEEKFHCAVWMCFPFQIQSVLCVTLVYFYVTTEEFTI